MNLENLKETEWKILVLFYGGDDHSYFYLSDITKALGMPGHKAKYHLKKLVKLRLIEEIGAYPKFWEPVKGENARREIQSKFTDYMRQWKFIFKAARKNG